MMSKARGVIILAIIGFLFCESAFSQESSEGANILFNEGLEYYNLGSRQEALRAFKKCLSVAPAHKGARRYLRLLLEPQRLKKMDYALNEIESINATHKSREMIYKKEDYSLKKEPISKGISIEEIKAHARRDFEWEKKIKEAKIKEMTRRQKEINKTLADVELEIGIDYQFVRGEQTFAIISSSTGERISKLTFPFKGGMTILNGEWKFHPRFSIGGRYGTSSLRRGTSSDEDWNFWAVHNGPVRHIAYQLTEHDSETKIDFFDLNLYYQILDLDKSQMNEKFSNYLVLDKFSLDIFGGYQQQTGRYEFMDPTTEYLRQLADDGSWWQANGLPLYDGLDSFYKIRYKGPRVGIRLKGRANDKFSSKLSFSYALIKTEAYGWWNLRSYRFWQKGDDGFAYNIDFDATYNLTPNWFIGIGYHYMKHRQGKLLESGDMLLPVPYTYTDEDIVRDADNIVHGPSFRVGYMW